MWVPLALCLLVVLILCGVFKMLIDWVMQGFEHNDLIEFPDQYEDEVEDDDTRDGQH